MVIILRIIYIRICIRRRIISNGNISIRTFGTSKVGCGRRLPDQLVDVEPTLQEVGPLPQALLLARVVEEDALVARPHDTPRRARHRRAGDGLRPLLGLLLLAQLGLAGLARLGRRLQRRRLVHLDHALHAPLLQLFQLVL